MREWAGVVFLIGLMYLLPTGAMGLVRTLWMRWRPASAAAAPRT